MPKTTALLLSLALATAVSARADEGVHWAYDGHGGPDHWAELSKDFSMCGLGRNQSPVNLAGAVSSSLAAIRFDYPLETSEIVNNGHTVQIDIAPGSSIDADGHHYLLKQVHFHTPSENQIDGKSFAAEAHFVHADADGNLAVVAVLFDDGRPFHGIALGRDQSRDVHDCPPDRYAVRHDFGQWPEWRVEWRVRGPRKDYAMWTACRRDPSPGAGRVGK